MNLSVMEYKKIGEVLTIVKEEIIEKVEEPFPEERIHAAIKDEEICEKVMAIPSSTNDEILKIEEEPKQIDPNSIFVSDGILSSSSRNSTRVSKIQSFADYRTAQSSMTALAKEKKKVYMKHYMQRKRLEHKMHKEAFKHLLIDGDLIAPTIRYYDKKREYMKIYMRSKRKEQQYKERKREYMKQYMRDRRLKQTVKSLMEIKRENSEDVSLNNSPIKITDIHSLIINNLNRESEDVPLNISPNKVIEKYSVSNNCKRESEAVPLSSCPVKVIDLNSFANKNHKKKRDVPLSINPIKASDMHSLTIKKCTPKISDMPLNISSIKVMDPKKSKNDVPLNISKVKVTDRRSLDIGLHKPKSDVPLNITPVKITDIHSLVINNCKPEINDMRQSYTPVKVNDIHFFSINKLKSNEKNLGRKPL